MSEEEGKKVSQSIELEELHCRSFKREKDGEMTQPVAGDKPATKTRRDSQVRSVVTLVTVCRHWLYFRLCAVTSRCMLQATGGLTRPRRPGQREKRVKDAVVGAPRRVGCASCRSRLMGFGPTLGKLLVGGTVVLLAKYHILRLPALVSMSISTIALFPHGGWGRAYDQCSLPAEAAHLVVQLHSFLLVVFASDFTTH